MRIGVEVGGTFTDLVAVTRSGMRVLKVSSTPGQPEQGVIASLDRLALPMSEADALIAYLQMSRLPADALDPRSRLIMVYAMCGFANFGSVGIMIGGLTVMAPERRSDVISLGMKSIVSGTISTLLMGAVVGLLN